MESPAEDIRARIAEVTSGQAEPDMVDAFAENCGRAVRWLTTSGVEFEPTEFSGYWGTTFAPRRLFEDVHAWRDRGPQRALQVLQRRLVTRGGSIIGGTTVVGLLDGTGRSGVGGIRCTRDGLAHEVQAPQVLLAEGGFQANPGMLSTYIGRFADRIKLGPPQREPAMRLGSQSPSEHSSFECSTSTAISCTATHSPTIGCGLCRCSTLYSHSVCWSPMVVFGY